MCPHQRRCGGACRGLRDRHRCGQYRSLSRAISNCFRRCGALSKNGPAIFLGNASLGETHLSIGGHHRHAGACSVDDRFQWWSYVKDANWRHPKREQFRSPRRRMIGALASASRPRSGEVTTAALSRVCLPAQRIAGRFLRPKVRERQLHIRALERSCPTIQPRLPTSSYISVTVRHLG